MAKEKLERDKVDFLEFLDYFVKQWFEGYNHPNNVILSF